MAARTGQTESSGGSAGSAGAPVSRHAGAAGEGGGWLTRREFGNQIEIRKVKLEKPPLMSRRIIRDAKCALRRNGARGCLSCSLCFLVDTSPINPSFWHLHDDDIRRTLLRGICYCFVVSRTVGNRAFLLFRESNPSI